jgi:hypothetical protein
VPIQGLLPGAITTGREGMHWYGRVGCFEITTTALGLEENARRVEVRSLAEMRPVFARLGDWMRVLGYC